MHASDEQVAALFEQYRDPLHRYITRFTGDPDLADDVVQDTYVRLCERPPPDASGLRGWLFTVATNLARDALKLSRRRLALVRDGVDRVPLGTTPPDPATAAERAETRRRVRRALDTLSERDRMILLMREEGFAHREIAVAVGTTTKSVGTMIARALEKAARALGMEEEA